MIDTSQSIQYHRLDGFTRREIAYFRVLVGSLVNDIANAEFIEHACDQAEVRWFKTWLRYRGRLDITVSSDDEESVKNLQENAKITQIDKGGAESRVEPCSLPAHRACLGVFYPCA